MSWHHIVAILIFYCIVSLEILFGRTEVSNTTIWMTPESFIERYIEFPSLLGSIIEFRSKKTHERNTLVSIRLRSGRKVSSKVLLRWYEVSWPIHVAGVATRSDYASQFDEDDEYGDASYPIVDKGYDLVFRLHDAGHTFIMNMLYFAHHAWSELSSDEADPQVAYLLEGLGYFRSTMLFKFIVGKKLFESEKLDELDEAIMAGRLTMVNDKRSFLAIKASYGY